MCSPGRNQHPTTCVERGILEKRLHVLITFTNTNTYYYIIVACYFANAGRVSLLLVVRTILRIGVVDDVKVVVISADFRHQSDYKKIEALMTPFWRLRRQELLSNLMDQRYLGNPLDHQGAILGTVFQGILT